MPQSYYNRKVDKMIKVLILTACSAFGGSTFTISGGGYFRYDNITVMKERTVYKSTTKLGCKEEDELKYKELKACATNLGIVVGECSKIVKGIL